jgi:transcriptional regulator with XRE-family HTH domain
MIGDNIRRLQAEKGIQCQEMAKLLGVLPQQYSRWRSADDIKVSTALKLCDVFGVGLDEIIFGQKEARERRDCQTDGGVS